MLKAIHELFKGGAQEATAEFRNHLRQTRSKAPPLRMELVAATDTAWLRAPAVEEIIERLAGIGFEPAGVVAVQGNDKVAMAGFVAPKHRSFATIPRTGEKAFVSFMSHFSDGTAVEYSNMPVPFEPPRPDWLIHRRHPGETPENLWAAFMAERPAKEAIETFRDGFGATNMENYARYQAWFSERGGATQDELAARFKAIGKLASGKEGEELLKMARSDEIESSLCNWWRLQKETPAPLEAVLDSLIIIHDELSPDLLINAYWCGTNDFRVKETEIAKGRPREAFARVVSERGGKLRKVLEKNTPLAADFYLPS